MDIKYGPYSPSRLDTAKCPYSFYRQYIDPNRPSRGMGNVAQERGSALHEVLELVTQELCKNPNAVFNRTTITNWVADAIARHPPAYMETEEIIDMVNRYIANPPKKLTSDATTELRLAVAWDEGEQKFVEVDYDSPKAVARGRADIFMISDDLLTGYIYDHKSQPNIEPADTAQMGFYAWVLMKIHPYLKEIRTVLHFTRYGCYSEEFVWTREMLQDVEDSVLTKIAVIERTQDWCAVPHDHCQYCPFIAECPALRDYIEVGEHGYRLKDNNFFIHGDTAKAVALAGLSHLIEEVQKVIKKELRSHVKQSGPIAIAGRVFEYRADTKIHWDKVNKELRPIVYKVFEEHGVDPKEFMSFNQTTTSNVWVIDNPSLVRKLAEVLPKRTSTEFGSHKI